MEEHLNDKHRLQEEWSGLCEYEPDPNKTDVGSLPENMTKNRYSNILPCKTLLLFNFTLPQNNLFLNSHTTSRSFARQIEE